jgi:flagellar hook-associated protein 2
MATITFGGLATGLNTTNLIDELVKVERRPITLLEQQQVKIEEKVALYQQLSSKIAALKTAATKLSTESSFFVKNAKSSNENVLVATSSANADAANHSVILNSLARASTWASTTFGDTATTTVGTGTLAITVGAETTNIIIDSSNNTLEGLRDAINNADADVAASIVTVNAGVTPSYRLVVSGKKTGLANAVSITETGLSGGTAPSFTPTQAANDANLLVDGIAIMRATNVVSDVIAGVTLDLKSASPGNELQVTVNNDIPAIEEQLRDLVAKYNDVMSFIAEKTKYDSATEQGGPLIGDSTLRTLRRTLQSVITAPVTGTPSILGEIGIATQKDGTLSVNGSKLSEALENNLDGVGNLFFAATAGVAKAVINYSDNAIRLGDGVLAARINGAQDEINKIEDRIAAKEDQVERFEQDLIRKFAALETLVSQINSQGNFLTQQLAALSAQFNNNNK